MKYTSKFITSNNLTIVPINKNFYIDIGTIPITNYAG